MGFEKSGKIQERREGWMGLFLHGPSKATISFPGFWISSLSRQSGKTNVGKGKLTTFVLKRISPRDPRHLSRQKVEVYLPNGNQW